MDYSQQTRAMSLPQRDNSMTFEMRKYVGGDPRVPFATPLLKAYFNRGRSKEVVFGDSKLQKDWKRVTEDHQGVVYVGIMMRAPEGQCHPCFLYTHESAKMAAANVWRWLMRVVRVIAKSKLSESGKEALWAYMNNYAVCAFFGDPKKMAQTLSLAMAPPEEEPTKKRKLECTEDKQ